VSALSVEDVGELLLELGLGSHREQFRKQKIDGAALLEMKDRMMKELGVENLVERKRLMHSVQLISRIGAARLTPATILQTQDGNARQDLLVATWGVQEVSQWLQEHGIPAETCAALARAGVTGEVLLNLKEKELKDFCTEMGTRLKIAGFSKDARERFYRAVQIFAKRLPSVAVTSGDPAPSPAPVAAVPATSPALPPEEYLCPITQTVMHDPVVATDGFFYERAAIERWLADHNTSPMTNAPLPDKTLRPAHALRSATLAWLEKHSQH